MSNRALLFIGLAALEIGLAGCIAHHRLGHRKRRQHDVGRNDGRLQMGSGMGGMMAEPMMVWRQGTTTVSSPQDAARLALDTAQDRGWTWLVRRAEMHAQGHDMKDVHSAFDGAPAIVPPTGSS